MKKSRPKIRPATLEDIRSLSEHALPSMRAWVVELDNEIIGAYGLVLWGGRWFIFVDIGEKLKPFKTMIIRQGKKTMQVAKSMGLSRVYAKHDTVQPLAEKWMKSLGFEQGPDYFVWRG